MCSPRILHTASCRDDSNCEALKPERLKASLYDQRLTRSTYSKEVGMARRLRYLSLNKAKGELMRHWGVITNALLYYSQANALIDLVDRLCSSTRFVVFSSKFTPPSPSPPPSYRSLPSATPALWIVVPVQSRLLRSEVYCAAENPSRTRRCARKLRLG